MTHTQLLQNAHGFESTPVYEKGRTIVFQEGKAFHLFNEFGYCGKYRSLELALAADADTKHGEFE